MCVTWPPAGLCDAGWTKPASSFRLPPLFETFSYDLPSVLSPEARAHWAFMESNSAAAVIQAVCPNEWADIVDCSSTYRLDPNSWLKAGGNRGDIAEQIDARFAERGWRETRLDLETEVSSTRKRGND